MSTLSLSRRPLLRTLTACSIVLMQAAGTGIAADNTPAIVHKVDASEDRIEMTVNTSKILTLESKIPRAQVNNPDILELTPIGAKQVQIHAKKPGITQVNLWDERNQVRAIDVVIYADVKELNNVLKSQFPKSSITIVPTANSVILTGFVDKSEDIDRIIDISRDYFPNVINNITVGGVQQVMLHVRVMEVSRTKLRDMGFDFADIMDDGSFFASGVSGLLRTTVDATVSTTGQETFAFGIVDPNNSFFGVLSALQQHSIAKVLAEPTLVTVSGRPAYFQSGGEIPVLIPQGLGNVSVEFRPFGTQVDFVPIVLGDGRVRLEVRPRVSEIDRSLSVTLNGSVIPGFRTRQVDTGVEMRVGQTLALAGLIQTRVESTKRGLPWICDLPYLGAPFRRVTETVNEIELLVMVRPELAEALDPHEVPACGPGESTMSPNDCDLLLKGHLEVPNPRCLGGECGNGNCANPEGFQGPVVAPQSTGSEDVRGTRMEEVPVPEPDASSRSSGTPRNPWVSGSDRTASRPVQPASSAVRPSQRTMSVSAPRTTPASAQSVAPRYNPPATNVRKPAPVSRVESGEPGLIGPTGYDVIN